MIATLARQAEGAQQDVAVVTGDLDLLQIVDEHTTVLTTRRGITDLGRYDVAAVRARFELDPRQLPDYRGLKGDPSDNLPGIPGVGEKTAIKLIKSAGSLDALLADPALAGSAKLEKLVRRLRRAGAGLPRRLADRPRFAAHRSIGSRPPTQPPSNDALYRLYRELEFKTLLNRLEPPATPVSVPIEEQLAGNHSSFVAATDPPDFAALAERSCDRRAGTARRDRFARRRGRVFDRRRNRRRLSAQRARAAARSAPRSPSSGRRVPQLVVYDAKAAIAALDVAAARRSPTIR